MQTRFVHPEHLDGTLDPGLTYPDLITLATGIAALDDNLYMVGDIDLAVGSLVFQVLETRDARVAAAILIEFPDPEDPEDLGLPPWTLSWCDPDGTVLRSFTINNVQLVGVDSDRVNVTNASKPLVDMASAVAWNISVEGEFTVAQPDQ